MKIKIILFLILIFIFSFFFLDRKEYLFKNGPSDYCKKTPVFLEKEGYKRILIDTTQKIFESFSFYDLDLKKTYYDNDWSKMGAVSDYILDKEGNIFFIQAPFIDLFDKKLLNQNIIWKLSTDSAVLNKWLEIDKKAEVEKNPFGTISLAYDCFDNSIYLSSIAGSDFWNEKGVLYKINLETKKIEEILRGVDIFSMKIYIDKGGNKKLYFSSAKKSILYSLDFDKRNKIILKSLKKEIDLEEYGVSDKIKKIKFLDDDLMILEGKEFEYSLWAASEIDKNIFYFEKKDGKWELKAWKK